MTSPPRAFRADRAALALKRRRRSGLPAGEIEDLRRAAQEGGLGTLAYLLEMPRSSAGTKLLSNLRAGRTIR